MKDLLTAAIAGILQNRLLWLLMVGLAGLLYAGETYRYDQAGRLVGVTYSDGSSITYRYDSNGNLLSRSIGTGGDLGTIFHRGDPNGDGEIDVSDGVSILLGLFAASAGFDCLESADVDNDGQINISDGVALLGFLFGAGPPPAPPGPASRPCGEDPDPPGSPGDLGCVSYDMC